jgi:hypothetical protein
MKLGTRVSQTEREREINDLNNVNGVVIAIKRKLHNSLKRCTHAHIHKLKFLFANFSTCDYLRNVSRIHSHASAHHQHFVCLH